MYMSIKKKNSYEINIHINNNIFRWHRWRCLTMIIKQTYVQSYSFNRTCLRVWLHHCTTHWLQHKGCIWTDMAHLWHPQKAWHQLPNQPKILLNVFLFLNKPGNECRTDAVIMDVGMSACEPALPVHTTHPTPPAPGSYAELLLGDAEEFGVRPWTGSLCANHHFKFLSVCRGAAPQLHKDNTTISGRCF